MNTSWRIHGCQASPLILMKVVNEMGKVVETSFHHINRKHGRTGHGSRLSAQSSPVSKFSCKAHTDLELTSDRRMHVQTDKRRCRRKALIVVARSHSSVVASCSEYKYSILIFCYGGW
jgi:hypothetical protein